MRSFRLALRASLALATLCADALSAEAGREAPRLFARDDAGALRPIEGFLVEGPRRTPFFIDASGERVHVRGVAGLAFGEGGQVLSYGAAPDEYHITARRDPADHEPFLVRVGIPEAEMERLWQTEHREITAIACCWLSDGRLEIAEIPWKQSIVTTFATSGGDAERGLRGIPVLFAFADGEILEPKPGKAASARLSRLDPTLDSRNTKVPKKWILAAARDGDLPYFEAALGGSGAFPRPGEGALREALLLTSENGRAPLVELLLDQGFDPLRESRSHKRAYILGSGGLILLKNSPATRALVRNHFSTWKLLLDHARGKASQKELSELARTAISHGNLPAAALLLDHGYRPTSPEDLRAWALLCLRSNRLDVLEQVLDGSTFDPRDIQQPNGDNAMHLAASYGDPELLEWLFEQGVPLDVADKHGHTPLIVAAGYSNLPAVCWLLDRGARIDHENQRGHTALQYAIVKQQSEAAACVFGYAPDIDKPGPHGVTPLMQAALFKDRYMAKALADAGALWNFDSTYSDPCLELALELDMPEILDAAILQGLAPGHRLYGKWPLPWAAAYFEAAACHELLAGATLPDWAAPTANPLPLRLSDFDAKRAIALAAKALSARVRFRCVIEPDGTISLPVIRSGLPRSDEQDLRNLLLSFRFERGETRAPSWLAAELEIVTDRNRRPFPQDIRTVSLREIPAPQQPTASGDRSSRDTAPSPPFPL